MEKQASFKICIIGLGYVGLPLAVLFAQKYRVIGMDIDAQKVQLLQQGIDITQSIPKESLLATRPTSLTSNGLTFTSQADDIGEANIYIITVPTPIDKFKRPDLQPLLDASSMVGKYLKSQDIVIYESTVYPGVTEEACVPKLEKHSGLVYNQDFFVGYSPERINPGDKKHTVENIVKLTSGSTPEAANTIDALYQSVLQGGTFKTSSIRVAEAAKVIENAQRDINIAFVNELAKIFNILEIDTQEVLAAAATKWNFLPFQPGLVGGHCIGVDPFYLAEKAKIHGYYPELILAGRRMNDSMPGFVAEQVVKAMIKNDIRVKGARVLLLGMAFKENCNDVRNSKVLDVYSCLKDYDCEVSIYDPLVDAQEAQKSYGIAIHTQLDTLTQYDAIVLAVAHTDFLHLPLDTLKNKNSIVYDVKGVLGKKADGRL